MEEARLKQLAKGALDSHIDEVDNVEPGGGHLGTVRQFDTLNPLHC